MLPVLGCRKAFFLTSADDLEPGAILVHRPRGLLPAEVTGRVRVLDDADVLHGALSRRLEDDGGRA